MPRNKYLRASPPRYMIVYWDDYTHGWKVHTWESDKRRALAAFRDCKEGPIKACYGPDGVVACEGAY